MTMIIYTKLHPFKSFIKRFLYSFLFIFRSSLVLKYKDIFLLSQIAEIRIERSLTNMTDGGLLWFRFD